jgi:hypothetical protein
MKRWIVVLVMLLAVAPAMRADEVSKRAKVQDLFVTMHMDRTMAQMMDLVMKQVHQMTGAMPGADQMTAEQKKLIDDFQKRVEVMVTDSMGWKALEPEYVTLYANTFSEEEIDGLLAFYKSPVGQTFLDKTPELTTKGGAIAQAKMAEVQPKLNAMLEDMMKQIMATMPPPSKPAPAKKPASHS